ncbi:MAG: hypothetical protein Q4F72_10570 [Desulfovibrionaceae bacterium]|nr:hypothetical protein [Desulfovibrionaceae bacterium]
MPTREQWAAVDWSKPVQEIADELGCSLAAVYQRRRRMVTGPDKVDVNLWKAVDWSRSDTEIMRERGCRRDDVELARRAAGGARTRRTTRTYICLTPEESAEVAALADAEGRSSSAWLREIILQYLQEHRQKKLDKNL